MNDLFEQSTLLEVRDTPEPKGPRLGTLLVLMTLVLLSLSYLFTFVPAILSSALDLLALAVLGGISSWGLLALAARVLR